MEELTPRHQSILKVIVSEYIASARPVGSDAIVEKYDLRVSPATVRNVMGVLEATGYIFHPHTSAGRVPSDRGYRFFVDHLVEVPQLSAEDQKAITQQFHQSEKPIDEWVQLAASILAQTTANGALATMPLSREARLRHLDLLSIRQDLAMLIVVFQDGTIRKQIVDLSEPVAEEEFERVARRLDEGFWGLTAGEIEAKVFEAPVPQVVESVRRAVVALMSALNEQGPRNVWYDGITQLLNQPEFTSVERLRELIGILDNPESLAAVLGGARSQEGVNLVIGEENPSQSLRGYTLILSRYAVPGGASGVIGIIGPTRMHYARAISSLRFISQQLEASWREAQD